MLLVRANLAPTAPKRRAGYQPRKATHSGRRSRRKGVRTERSIVNALQGYGLSAVRVPLSGAVGGRFAGDIVLPLGCVEGPIGERRLLSSSAASGLPKLPSWPYDHASPPCSDNAS